MTILKTLLEITAYSAVLFGVIMLARALLKKHISPALQYMAWFILLIRLLMPVTINSGFSFFVMPAAQTSAAVQAADLPALPEGVDTPDTVHADITLAADMDAHASDAVQNQAGENTAPTTQESSVSPMQVPPEAALIALWLLGVAVMLAQMRISALRLKKRLRTAHPISTEWQRMAAAQREILGIKGRIRIVMIAGFPSPALCAGIRPVVVLPEELLSQTEEQIRFALLHELTHIKRRDHMVSLLLFILRAVYWFNPVVWLTVYNMRHDMETVCDNSLTALMSAPEKKRYAGTVLSMYARPQERYVLGLALGKTKKSAAQRLRGIYMRSRSSAKARAAAFLLSAVLLLTCFTTACQPTPETPFVQSKDNDSVKQAIDSDPAEIFHYSAPETWQSETHDEVKKIHLYVDAKVDVSTDVWGLYALKPIEPTLGDVQKILNAVAGDAAIYGEQTIQGKSFLLEQIMNLEWQKTECERLLNEGGLSEDERLAQETAENGGKDRASVSTLSEEDLRRNIDNFTNMINEAKAKLATAPDDNTVVQNEFVLADMFKENMTPEQANQSGFGYQKDGGYIMRNLIGKADLGRQTPADIYMYLSSGEYSGFNLIYIDYDDYEQSFSSGKLYTGQQLFKCDINVEEAAETARAKIREMGFDYLDIEKTNFCDMLDRKRMDGERLPECFEFVFTRSMDDATATYARGDGVWTDEKELALQYAPNWRTDEVTVHVDDSGVIGIRINTPKSDVEKQAYGIKLKDFEEIMGIFEKQLFLANAFVYDDYADKVLSREIHINNIRLGYMPTAWKDQPGQIIFAPVWDFFGYEVVSYEEGIGGDFGEMLDKNYRRTNDLGSQSLLTINALDGTIMLRP